MDLVISLSFCCLSSVGLAIEGRGGVAGLFAGDGVPLKTGRLAKSNPGPNIALESIQAGGYNTGVGFTGTTDPIDGISSISTVFPGFETGEVQFSWPNDGQADPNTMAMVFLFCSDVQVWQMGWGSENGGSLATMAERFAIGDTYEGGNIFGAGGEASYGFASGL